LSECNSCPVGRRPEACHRSRRCDKGISRRNKRGTGCIPLDLLVKSVFVGREGELQLLRAAVDDAQAGRGRLVLLAGEPGIGKTRTCEELAASTRAQGAQVLWGRCYEGEGAPPFWPWVQIIRAAARGLDGEALGAALGDGAADVAQIVPQLREWLPDLPRSAVQQSPDARFRLFDAVTWLLETVARRAPLVVILDDLHGADPSSVLLLQFIARHLHDVPLLVVGTYRNLSPAQSPPLTDMFVEALRAPGGAQLQLRGLSEPEVGRFVELSAGVQPAPALVHALHQRTEGNPLFVGEFVRVLAAEQRLQGTEAASWNVTVPHGVQAVIERRLEMLSAECKRVLRVGAVIGREFGVHVAAAVLLMIGVAAGAVSATDVPAADALEEAEEAGIVGEMPESAGRYRFAHALIRETLYDVLRPSERAQLHRLVGTAMERLPDADEYLAELAYHFFEAGEGSTAVTYARRAGDRAMALLAYEEAVRLYTFALSSSPGVATGDQSTQCVVLVDLGIAQNAAGDIQASKATLLRAAEIAKRLGLREELCRAALHFGTKFGWGEQPAPDPDLLDLLEAALATWGDTDSPLHARVLARVAAALRFSEQHERRIALSGRALDMARRLGDPVAIAHALHARHVAHWTPDNLDERIAVATELVELARQVRDFELELQGHAWRFDDLFERGDRVAAEGEIVICEQLAARLRQPLYQWQNRNAHVMLLTMEGQFAAAERVARENLVLGQGVNSGAVLAFTYQMFALACAQGRRETFEAAADSVGELARQFPTFPVYRCALACIARELGRAAAARAEFEQLSAKRFADLAQDQTWLLFLRQLAEVCAFLHDTERAEALAALLAPYEARALTAPGAYWGPVSHYLGLLETILSRWDDATRHFEHALEMNRRARAWPWLARTQYEYACMLLARGAAGDQERAAVLLQQALTTAQDLGMELLIERAQALQHSAGSAGPQRAARTVQEGLAAAAATSPPSVIDHRPSTNRTVFRRGGDYWIIAHAGTEVQLKNSKGLQYLAHLLRHPNQEFLALDLVGQSMTEDRRQTSDDRQQMADSGRGGVQLDAQARAAYTRRLHELREELSEAETNNDIGRAERARTEIEMLGTQLRGALGLGGRTRAVANAADRARSAVGKRIRAEIARIRAVHPALGRHLALTISTGYLCAYEPQRDAPVVWEL